MTDYAEHLIAAKAAIDKAERELALQRPQNGVKAMIDARFHLWNAIDIVNVQSRDKV